MVTRQGYYNILNEEEKEFTRSLNGSIMMELVYKKAESENIDSQQIFNDRVNRILNHVRQETLKKTLLFRAEHQNMPEKEYRLKESGYLQLLVKEMLFS